MWTPLFLFTILLYSAKASKKNETETEIAHNRFNEFDWNLSKAVGKTINDNVVISPISIKVVLAMLYEGAHGKSAKELEDALQLMREVRMLTPSNFSKILSSLQEQKEGIDLDIGTKLYIDLGAKPNKSFKSKIEQLYNATIEPIDFKNTSHAVRVINTWAKSVTHGHIEHLLSDADCMDSTVLLLLNAVYFRGLWKYPFQSNMTSLGEFKAHGKLHVSVQYMHALLDLMYMESPALNARIIRLPYIGDKSAMYIILPEKDDGLDEAIGMLNPQTLRELLSNLQKQPIQLKLPKFKIEMASSLLPALKKLGINDIFESTADLSGLVEGANDSLVVSNVIQKAGVEVNEHGSIAYVATEVELVSKFGEHAVEVNVTRPFLFFIKDEVTDTVLFVGKVVNPLQEGLSQVSAPPPRPTMAAQTTQAPITTTTPDSYQLLINALNNKLDEGPQVNGSQKTTQPNTQIPDRFGSVLATSQGQVYHRETPLNIYDLERFSYFDAKILSKLALGNTDNWVISPASIKTTLGILYQGANGTTATEISNALRLPDRQKDSQKFFQRYTQYLKNPESPVKLKSASRVLHNLALPLSAQYEEAVGAFFDVKVDAVNPKNPKEVVSKVNSWVSNYTQGLISSIVEESLITPNLAAIFLNAVYFKGDWKIEFHPRDTTVGCFSTASHKCVRTNFMSSTANFKYGIDHLLKASVLQMPYNDPRYSMIIILPLNPRTPLSTLAEDLSYRQLETVITKTLREAEVMVTIPNFTIEYSINLLPTLQQMGILKAFSQDSDLSGMFQKGEKAGVSGIFHKAKIEVNEKGTVAAGSTVAFVETLSSSQTVRFTANRPFLFFVHDEKAGIIFEGQFSNPSELSKVEKAELPKEKLSSGLSFRSSLPEPETPSPIPNEQLPQSTVTPGADPIYRYPVSRNDYRRQIDHVATRTERPVFYFTYW